MNNFSYFSKYLWDVDNLCVFSACIATLGLPVNFFWYFKLFLFPGLENLSTVKMANTCQRKIRLFPEILLYLSHQNFRKEKRHGWQLSERSLQAADGSHGKAWQRLTAWKPDRGRIRKKSKALPAGL